MMVNLTHISSWIWIIGIVVLVILLLRFSSHLVAAFFHFILRFFWHGCATIVVLVLAYFLLHSLHVL